MRAGRRLRLRHGRKACLLAHTHGCASGLGAAADPLRGCGGQGEPPPCRRPRVRQRGGVEARPAPPRQGGLRVAEEAVRKLFAALLATSTAVALAFLVLPVAAIFLRVPPGDLVGALGHHVTRDALLVSLETSAIAHAAVLLVGTPAAYLLARRRFPGRGVVLTLVELPLVLPPAVAGIALFAAFGRAGLLGQELDALGVQVPFTQAAVVLAVAFVESPFYFRGAIAAFEAVDGTPIGPARTLGPRPTPLFLTAVMPPSARWLRAGPLPPFARASGEFRP